MGRGSGDRNQSLSILPRLRAIGPRPSQAYGQRAKELSDLLRQSVDKNAEEVVKKMEDLVRYSSPTLLKNNYRLDEDALRALYTCTSWSHDGLSGSKSVLTDEQAGNAWLLSEDQGGNQPNLDHPSLSLNNRIAYGHLSAATGMGRIRLAGAVARLLKADSYPRAPLGEPIDPQPLRMNKGPIRMNKGPIRMNKPGPVED